MPKKITTEIQYMRQLSNTALQINIDLLRVDQHVSRNTPQSHLDTFYHNFDEVKDRYYDGMIITGAPLDQVDFADVSYWPALEEMIKWSAEHVTSTLFSCWGAAAALKIFYDLPMMQRRDKLSGVYLHNRAQTSDPLIRGFDDVFYAPQSRFIDFPTRVIEDETDLHILADCPEAGMFLGVSPNGRQVYVTGHPEYDGLTLAEEYRRDLNAGKNPQIPVNYFPHDDPQFAPPCTWRAHGALRSSALARNVKQVPSPSNPRTDNRFHLPQIFIKRSAKMRKYGIARIGAEAQVLCIASCLCGLLLICHRFQPRPFQASTNSPPSVCG